MATERATSALACLAVLLLGTGCAGAGIVSVFPLAQRQPSGPGGWRAPVRPAFAAVEVYSAPVQVNFNATKLGSKRGSGNVIYIQDPLITGQSLVSFGGVDASSIAQRAGITNITHMDYRMLNVLGVFIRMELLVYGD